MKIKLPRFFHAIYAFVGPYFWLPCRLCGKKFGGHEYKSGDVLMTTMNEGEMVCPNCGDKARELNEKNFPFPSKIFHPSCK